MPFSSVSFTFITIQIIYSFHKEKSTRELAMFRVDLNRYP